MKRIDLNTPEYTAAFQAAPLFVKKAIVDAVLVTAEALQRGEYSDLGVRYDEAGKTYVIDTYVMATEGESRVKKLENTREVVPGLWIVTNPRQQEGDCLNCYAMDAATFQKKYEPMDDGRYRARGKARIIQNDTGCDVDIIPPWGGDPQTGTADCYFCCSVDSAEPEAVGDNRYLLSQNDFGAYVPAEG